MKRSSRKLSEEQEETTDYSSLSSEAGEPMDPDTKHNQVQNGVRRDEADKSPDAWSSESEREVGSEEEDELENSQPRVYLPGLGDSGELGGDLVCDESAYAMYHTCGTLLPCLSFDIIPDNFGDNRATFPATCYCVAGSQAEKINKNSLLVMRMSNLTPTKPPKGSDDESSDEESDDEDEQPELECAQIRHYGSVNRLKFTRVDNVPLTATFSETGSVHLWNLNGALSAVDDSRLMSNFKQNASDYVPLFSFQGHKCEGFALSWSKAAAGLLASGDCHGAIHVWKPHQAGQWQIDQQPYKSHTSSVEDIQWSPNETNVFASCSSDRSIRIWDIRQKPSSACMLTVNDAHSVDVNVIHWNSTEPFLVSGSDAGDIKIWDLRQFATENAAVAVFRHHRGPICSIEWHPTDSTVFAAAGEDNQLTQWDIAVEKGEDEPRELDAVPPQLLFIHQGQTEIKELHWHPQIPGLIMSSALNGIDVFRTISV